MGGVNAVNRVLEKDQQTWRATATDNKWQKFSDQTKLMIDPSSFSSVSLPNHTG